jgi:hypothetical protein
MRIYSLKLARTYSHSGFKFGLSLPFRDVQRWKRSAQFSRLILDGLHVSSQNNRGACHRSARVDELP